jgi:hypothetical protein
MLYDRNTEIILERVLNLMNRREAQSRPLSQAQIAGACGVSPATVSNFLNRKDLGDVEKIAALLKSYIEREEAKDEGGLLRVPFVETGPAKTMLARIHYCHTYQRMGALIGGAGIGKTTTIRQAVKRDPSLIVMTAWGNLGAAGVIQELCEAVKVGDRGSLRALMKRLRHKLQDKGRCVVVDDAHTLTFKALDILRHVYDVTGTGIVLVGIPTLRRHLVGANDELEQLASRVGSRLWELPEFTLDDARLFFGALMSERDTQTAMSLLADDPRSTSSGRWLGDVIEIAGLFAKKRGHGAIGVEDLKRAIKAAA